MIRMGRTNTNMKPETSPLQPETPNLDANKSGQSSYNFSPQTSEAPPFRAAPATTSETSPNSNRAFTDSEGMARDIKEGRLSGYVGGGTSLTGETEFKSMLRVDGHLVGKVTSESGTLHIGSGGLVDANIAVSAAIIYGTVNGDIIASDRIELGRTAKVVGNVQTPSLMMEQGAILEGNCSMMQAKSAFDKRAVQNVVETVRPERETTVPAKTESVPVTAAENGAVVTAS